MSIGSRPIVVFNCTKNEAFSPSKRFKTWARALSRTFEVRENNDKYVPQQPLSAAPLYYAMFWCYM
jgi:hypothetical protein